MKQLDSASSATRPNSYEDFRFDYEEFSSPDCLAMLGRDILKRILAPVESAIADVGRSMPDLALPDEEYFPALSHLLRSQANGPGPVAAALIKLREDMTKSREAFCREQERLWKGPVVRLRRAQHASDLLATLKPCYGMDFDLGMAEQVPGAISLKEYLADYLSICDQGDPEKFRHCESVVAGLIENLNQSGCGIFADRLQMIGTDGKPVPILLARIVRLNDPRVLVEDDIHYIHSPLPPCPQDAPIVWPHVSGASAVTSNVKAAAPAAAKEVNADDNEVPFHAGKAKFKFRKAGCDWDVVFDGGEQFGVKDTFGARYIDHLLHSPNKPISSESLEIMIKAERANARAENSDQKESDSRAKRDYRREIRELVNDLQTAEANSNSEAVIRLNEEISALRKQAYGNRNMTGSQEKARNNVRKAIDAVIRKLRNGGPSEKAFAGHLCQSLHTGKECMYNQAAGPSWK